MDEYGQADESDTRRASPDALTPESAGDMPAPLAPPQPDEGTVELSPEALAAIAQRPIPQRPIPAIRSAPAPKQDGRPAWVYALTAILVVAIVAAGSYALLQSLKGHGSSTNPSGCGTGTPCQVANAYIAAFTGARYDEMYALTSQASRARFGDPAILHAAAKYPINAVDYTSAQDYITHRTQYIVAAADIYNMAATAGAVHTLSATQATVPVRLIMTSARVGDIAEDITLPLRLENNAWRVDWSPGLIFSQLDSASDPNYTGLVRLLTAGYEGQRGAIYDSADHALAMDGPVYQIQVCPSQIKDQTAVAAALTKNIDLTQGEITSAYQGRDAAQCYAVRTITRALYTKVGGALNVAGIQSQQTTGRVYPYGEVTAAITGYVGQVSPQDLSADTSHYYESGNIIGRAGVEQWGEKYLRPLKGGKLVIRSRNADGSDGPIQATIAERQAVNGDDVHTTINLAAQQAAMAKLQSDAPYSGGAMAVNPVTGEALVLASSPMYDPNDLALGLTANAQARLNALDHPYLDRAVQTAVPVGSAFKLITLSAGLQNGVTPSQIFTCPGSFTLPGVSHVFVDDKPSGHGSLTAPHALAPSCDVVFWKIGAMLNDKDPNLLPNTAKAFGYGAPTNMVGLPGGVENPGIVPDPDWLKQNQNATWSAVDAVNLAIGQGYFQATPAQMTMATAAIGNGGKRLRPRLVSTVTDTTGATVFSSGSPDQNLVGTLPLSADNLQVVQVAMLGPTHDADGTTRYKFLNYPINVAGKTGTAESGRPKPHAWFTCFAPASPISGPPVTPKVAASALVEYSSYGETFAVPVTKEIMDSLFGLPSGT